LNTIRKLRVDLTERPHSILFFSSLKKRSLRLPADEATGLLGRVPPWRQ
jgi:hypothetical protein